MQLDGLNGFWPIDRCWVATWREAALQTRRALNGRLLITATAGPDTYRSDAAPVVLWPVTEVSGRS